LVAIATSLQGSKNYFHICIYSCGSSSPANLAKIGSVDFEIIGLTEIETEAGLAEQVDPVSRRFR